jgi:hypothetical protein
MVDGRGAVRPSLTELPAVDREGMEKGLLIASKILEICMESLDSLQKL